MRLAWVELRDFRNDAHTRIDPMPDGLAVAVGPNGEGKTNLLEGMHLLYALRVRSRRLPALRGCVVADSGAAVPDAPRCVHVGTGMAK